MRAASLIGLVSLLLMGCPGEPAAPVEREEPAAPKLAAAEAAPAPSAAGPEERSEPDGAPVDALLAEPAQEPALRGEAPWAPAAYAPALGLAGPDGLRIAVDPLTGEATCFEVDAAFGSAAIRRARTGAGGEAGLFGLGWRAEIEARLEVEGPGACVVTRPAGRSRFVQLEDELFVSVRGDVEYLRLGADGEAALLDVHGRALVFDRAGQLVAVEPHYRIERTAARIRLLGDAGALDLDLDAEGRVVRARGGKVDVRYRYDAAGELVGAEGSFARSYRAQDGRLTEARAAGAAGGEVALGYDRAGRIASISAGARLQRYAFTEQGGAIAIASVTTPKGRWRYRLGPAAWEVETPRGRERVELDRRGRVVAVVGVDGRRRARPVDALGLPVTRDAAPSLAQAIPCEVPVEVERDARGRRVAIAAGAAEEARAYDALGRLASRTDAAGRTTRYRYAAGGGPLMAVETASGRVHVVRDAAGRVVAVETPSGRRWRVERDAAGRTVAEEGPAGLRRYLRDAQGQVLAWRDASGREVRLRRTAAGEVADWLAEGGPHGPNEGGGVLRRPDGALVLTTNSQGHTHRLVSRVLAKEAGREVVRVEVDLGGDEGPLGLTTTFTPVSERVETPWGVVARTLDPRRRVAALDSPAGRFAFRYDAEGRRTALVYPSGVEVAIARDALGREVGRDGGEVLSLRERLDARHQRVERVHDGLALRAAYDGAGRLTAWQLAGKPPVRYRYDGDGNRVAEQHGERPPRFWRYDAAGRLEQAGDDRLVHDAAGRLLERGRADGTRDRFRYDGRGRLVAVARAGRPEVRYSYDPLGRWATRTVGEATTRFVYEGERLLAEVGPGERVRVYMYGPALDEPLAYRDGEGPWTFLHTDRLGTVVAYSDARGRRVDRALWAPFGELLRAPRADRPRFYAGRWVDPVAGVVSMRARVYDPELGRFLTPDPAGLEGGLSAYAYADNAPLERKDPLGLWPWTEEEEAAEGGAGGVGAAPSARGLLLDQAVDTAVGAAEGLGYLMGGRGSDAEVEAARQPLVRWLEEKAAAVRDLPEKVVEVAEATGAALQGAGEGLGYLTGFHGDAQSRAAARGYVADRAADTARTVAGAAQGAVEGAGYLTGLHGDAASHSAARAASLRDLTDGGAQSRALGAIDGYLEGLTGIDPDLSKRYAIDPDQAEVGYRYGLPAGTTASLVSAGAAWQGARAARLARAAEAPAVAAPAVHASAKTVPRATPAAARAVAPLADELSSTTGRLLARVRELRQPGGRTAPRGQPVPSALVGPPKRGMRGAVEGEHSVTSRPSRAGARNAGRSAPSAQPGRLEPRLGGFRAGISAAEIQEINKRLGGTHALNGGHASSALAAAAHHEGFWSKTAAVVRRIAGDHMFNDANKRTAFAVVKELRRRNNVLTGVSPAQTRRVIDRVARGELEDVREIARALRGS